MEAIKVILKQGAMQTSMFNKALDGVSDEQGLVRLNGDGNHLRWIAGHLTVIRYRLARRYGAQIEDYPHLDKYVLKDVPVPPNARALDTNIEYPTVKQIHDQWNYVSPLLWDAVAKLTPEELNTELKFKSPLGNAVIDSIAFTVMHEAYHVGQMSIIRKAIGHKAMNLLG
jgi:hypothetical protein